MPLTSTYAAVPALAGIAAPVPVALGMPGPAASTLTPAQTFLAAATPSPSPGVVEEAAQAVVKASATLLSFLLRGGIGIVLGLVAAAALVGVLSLMARRQPLWREVHKYGRRPLYLGGALLGAWLGTFTTFLYVEMPAWGLLASRLLLVGVVLSGTWFVVGLAKAAEAGILSAFKDSDSGRRNRVRTQTQVLRRVIETVIMVCGVVGAAMVFPSARLAMGSLLASAGLVSVIAGLAAQSTLGNVFAGLQLAATDAIRVGDVVKVEEQQGTVEEITLTYVVVRPWDDRRMIFPSSQFTQHPFSNLSRRGTQVTGTMNLELDFRVPVARVRAELERIVAAQADWDGREASLQVTDATKGAVTLRIVLSGRDTANVFGLQCQVREQLLAWLQTEAPEALPQLRVITEASGATAGGLSRAQEHTAPPSRGR
ncbi:Mechanosensitive ion channel [Actinomyces bovis]|uniref:Mechanosensitive ion channel n=1 Tax=Actinomyces bovis TaxID=1658 RepID=A0ABY1VN18_9ACTO|nr:mechanosensitive ion channel family protein [Actinomyces bovis]SPT53506.1 Mechanosensitive ion channel [Actinomyces bovis]VEG55424.1 Mechanosensitive ion channel [Actinomyces israelii]